MEKEHIFELVVKHVCQLIPKLKSHTFQAEDNLRDLGVNSLERTELIDMTTESLSLEIPRVKVFGAKNIGELVDILHREECG